MCLLLYFLTLTNMKRLLPYVDQFLAGSAFAERRRLATHLLMVCLLCLSTIACSKKPIYQSLRAEDNEELPRFSKDKISYDVYRHPEHVEVRMLIADPMIQVKVLRFGMTVWLNTKGKEKMTDGIKYPIGQIGQGQRSMDREQMEKMRQEGGGDPNERLARIQEEFSKAPAMVEVIGFGHEGEGNMYNLAYGDLGVDASITFDESRAMHYTMLIPTSMLFPNGIDEQPLAIGLISGALELGANGPGRMGGRPGGMMGGGMGGRAGGMMGGGMAGGMGGRGGGMNQQRMQQMMAMTEPEKIWFKISVDTD